MREIPLVLLGFGAVGRSVARLVVAADGYRREGVHLTLHSIFDRRGGIRVGGRDLESILESKRREGTVAGPRDAGRLEAAEALDEAPGAVLVDASVTDAETGGPGLAPARTALASGRPVVFASKGPLVAAYSELSALARRSGAGIGVSAAVGIPLPTLEVALQGVRGAGLRRIRGILNDTANQILRALESGVALDDAVAAAVEAGTIEADPRLDLDGWDAAYKLLILARILWDPDLSLDPAAVTGVGAVTARRLVAARSEGRRIRLVATGVREEDGPIGLEIAPEALAPEDPLHSLGPGEKGLALDTERMGRMVVRTDRGGPLTTAACVIKDVLNLVAPVRI